MDDTDRESPRPMATVYVDQNIIGYIANGSLPFPRGTVVPVISPEHFSEIARGDALHLLDTLEEIEAQELTLHLDDKYRFTDHAALSPLKAVRSRYAEHVTNMKEGSAHIGMFQALVARTWGADNQRSLLDQLGALPETILPTKTTAAHPEIGIEAQRVSRTLIDVAKSRLAETILLATLRRTLGVHGGPAGNVDPKNAIPHIWEQIASSLPGVTMDQFFWKEPIERLGYDRWPLYMAVVSCHGMLNTLGFRPDKGMSDEARTPNILSDGIHLANAVFCNALLTADKRLADKAEAIYSFLGVGTHVLRVNAPKRAR